MQERNELDINVNEETQHLNCNCNVFQKQLPIACFQMIIQTSLVQERLSASNIAAFQPLTSMNPAVGVLFRTISYKFFNSFFFQ